MHLFQTSDALYKCTTMNVDFFMRRDKGPVSFMTFWSSKTLTEERSAISSSNVFLQARNDSIVTIVPWYTAYCNKQVTQVLANSIQTTNVQNWV